MKEIQNYYNIMEVNSNNIKETKNINEDEIVVDIWWVLF